MKTNPLFLKLTECQKKIIVCQGGGDAGKTVSILQRLAMKSIYKRGNIATVTAETIPNVKGGALRTFQRYVLPDVEKYVSQYNATERMYRFFNGSIIEFRSFKDDLGARGSERDDLFMNEANAETYDTFWQLQRKTRSQVFLDYNPTHPFWVHNKVLPLTTDGKPNEAQDRQYFNKVQLFIVDHRHNLFLSKEDHEAYESISDKEMFRVYSRGQTGKIKGLIFGHFKKWFDPFPIMGQQRIIWGLDYGYSNDPTALLRIAVNGRRRVAQELSYEPGLSAESIKNIMLNHGLTSDMMVYSEADPNMINQLRMLGMPVYPAIKGPGSIAAGISKVREHECYYTHDSLNFEKEIGMYKWMAAQDVTTGKEVVTNVPVDGWDHCCDAFRYADYTDSFRNR